MDQKILLTGTQIQWVDFVENQEVLRRVSGLYLADLWKQFPELKTDYFEFEQLNIVYCLRVYRFSYPGQLDEFSAWLRTDKLMSQLVKKHSINAGLLKPLEPKVLPMADFDKKTFKEILEFF